MSELFLTVLNMSLTASYVIIFVILIRLLLKKAPKVISYALWSVVAFRLLIPFSFESIFSLMPRNTNTVPIPHDIIYQQSPQINSGIEVVDSFLSNSLPAPAAGTSVNPLQIYTEIGAYIWVLGIIALLVYSLVSILILKRQLKNAQLIEKNIFEAKNLKTPFVLGLIRPKIYLPVGLNLVERNYILLHEQVHIHRKDHIIKVLAFLTLSVHWFNPLVWISFLLMNTDMELSCDEQVLSVMGQDIKKSYANSLLSLAAGRHILNGSPLAFGEGNVKGRIKNVLNYKRPKFWVIVLSIAIVAAVGVGLAANPDIYKDNNRFQLNFSEIVNTKIENLQLNNIKIIEEIIIDKDLSAFIFTDNENGEVKGAINLDGKSYYIGQVSMKNTPDNLMGIEELQVFGKKAVKFYGVLGANYAQAFYWFVEEKTEDSIIQIDGHTVEIDLDNDDKKEIVSTLGTIPETRIYMLKKAKIYVSDINQSIGAKSVRLQDEGKKLFEVYFEPNKPEQFVFNKDSFIRQ